MNRPSTTSTLTRRSNVVLIGLFMTLLWLPTLDTVLHLDWTPPHGENRALAAFPKLQPGWHGLQPYVVGLEAYFNDHFGCRKCLVMWNNKLRWSLFKDKSTRSVLVGKDGWLFTTDFEMIDHYRGQLQFTSEQLRDWQVLLEKRRDWLARRGIVHRQRGLVEEGARQGHFDVDSDVHVPAQEGPGRHGSLAQPQSAVGHVEVGAHRVVDPDVG